MTAKRRRGVRHAGPKRSEPPKEIPLILGAVVEDLPLTEPQWSTMSPLGEVRPDVRKRKSQRPLPGRERQAQLLAGTDLADDAHARMRPAFTRFLTVVRGKWAARERLHELRSALASVPGDVNGTA